MASASITLYPSPLDGGDYLAVLDSTGSAPFPEPGQTQVATIGKTKTIIILDVSGSMGSYVNMCVDKIFPAVFAAHGYQPDEEIELIRFECSAHHTTEKVSSFGSLGYQTQGGTNMAPVFPVLTKILKGCEPGSNVRIIAVSDGDVFDTDATIAAASTLSSTIDQYLLNIDTVAIRLFSSTYAQPDTRALSTMLSLNNTFNTPSLIDIVPDESKTQAQIAEQLTPQMISAFDIKSSKVYLAAPGVKDDTIARGSEQDIENTHSLFRQHPWANSSMLLPLAANAKRTLLWIRKSKWDALNDGAGLTALTISDELAVPVTVCDSLTGDIYEEIIATRIQHYMLQIKLLRVVGSEHSLKQIKLMADYFVKLEAAIFTDASTMSAQKHDTEVLHKLDDRLKRLFKEAGGQIKRLAQSMQEIANMDATTQFNSAQAASFLRSTGGTGAASRGLVRRAAVDAYTDFDGEVRREVMALAGGFDKFITDNKITPEIEETFKSSFVSLGTTIDGLRALQTLARTSPMGLPLEEKDWNNMNASIISTMSSFDLLSYFNIVGLPVQSTIGDYPDPFRYNINVAFTGAYCSLSDLINMQQSEEQPPVDPNADPAALPAEAPKSNLSIPGYRGDAGRIDNVIPLFDTMEMAKFFSTNAPKSLLYLSSIGMRRVMASIAETQYATLSAALVKLMRVVLVEPTEANFKALRQVLSALQADSQSQACQSQRIHEMELAVQFIRAQEGRIAAEPPTPTPFSLAPSINQHYVSLTSQLTRTDPQSPPIKYLPHVQSPFAQFLYPLAMAYRNKSFLSPVSDADLATITRSMYVNEVWLTLRNIYRGKEDSVKQMKSHFESFIGVDPAWQPELTPMGSEDPAFSSECMPSVKSTAFGASKTWKDVNRKLNRLNIILAVPYFAKLFDAYINSNADLIDELQASPPRVIMGAETPEMLAKATKLAQYRKMVGDNDADDYGFGGDDDVDAPQDAAEIDRIKTLIAEMEEDGKGFRDEVVNGVEVEWPQVLFGIEAEKIGDTVQTSYQHLNTLKMVSVAAAFLYPEPNNRFIKPHAQLPIVRYLVDKDYGSFLQDIPYTDDLTSLPFIKSLIECRTDYYHGKYSAAVAEKEKKTATQGMIDYRQKMLDAPTMAEFNNLLSNGLLYSSKLLKFSYGYRDRHLVPLWQAMIDKDTPNEAIPHRLDKLEVLILGVDSSNNNAPVWNGGNILLDHNLHQAASVFYTEDPATRAKWIQISETHKARRQAYQYRPSDITNRHSHKKSNPSFYSFGYETIVEFKAAVTAEVYKDYCEKHKDCCGFTPVGEKRQRLKGTRHFDEKAADATAPEAVAPAAVDANAAAAPEEGEEEESIGDLFG